MELSHNRPPEGPTPSCPPLPAHRRAQPVGPRPCRCLPPTPPARRAARTAGGVDLCCGGCPCWGPDLGRGRGVDPRHRPGRVVPVGGRGWGAAADRVNLPAHPGRDRRRRTRPTPGTVGSARVAQIGKRTVIAVDGKSLRGAHDQVRLPHVLARCTTPAGSWSANARSLTRAGRPLRCGSCWPAST